MKKNVIVAGSFDAPGSQEIRLLHEASHYGTVHLAVIDDELFIALKGYEPKYPLAERFYFLENIRYVDRVQTVSSIDQLHNIGDLFSYDMDHWVDAQTGSLIRDIPDIAEKQSIPSVEIDTATLTTFPEHKYDAKKTSGKKVVVTGSFDLFHTGHVRFFEEASEYGDLYVIVGHDKNIGLLKGPNHPMYSEEERKYVAGSIRFVKQALVSSGEGWMDAEPEIAEIKPDYYVVNEDGNKEEKRHFCDQHGIEYIVLERKPKPGLPGRSSTSLRGF